jgi:hypothetical protein
LKFSEVELFGYASESGQPQWPPLSGPLFDDDADGRENLLEYALDGDPSDDQDLGVDPTFVKAGSAFEYTYLKRNNDPNLIYTVEMTTDLITGFWTNTGYMVLGTNVTGGVYDEVTSSIPTDSPQSYIRLKIENQ